MNKNDLDYNEDELEEGSFLKRNWLALTVGVLVLAGGTSAAIALSSKGGAGSRKAQDSSIVQIQLPPPVVLPPPPPPPPMEEEMIQHEDEVKEEAPAEDTAPSTGIVSNGPPDGYGMRSKGGAGKRNMIGRRSTVSTWAPYAGQAASRIADAMRRHNKLKHSTMSITAKVWIDGTGRITRATTQSTGDAALDAALRDDVLNGMQLSGPPPEGMKMPVNLKLSARRPG
jgi:periplasmic protein TonB